MDLSLKTLLIIFSGILFSAFSMQSRAVEAEGNVVEIRVCGSGNQDTWRHITFVKLSDDNWIHMYSNYGIGNDYDDYDSFALVMAAYENRYKVKIKATRAPMTLCGITSAAGFVVNQDDYVALTEFSDPDEI